MIFYFKNLVSLATFFLISNSFAEKVDYWTSPSIIFSSGQTKVVQSFSKYKLDGVDQSGFAFGDSVDSRPSLSIAFEKGFKINYRYLVLTSLEYDLKKTKLSGYDIFENQEFSSSSGPMELYNSWFIGLKPGFIVNNSLFYGIIGYTNSKLKDLSNENPFISKNHSGSKIGFGLRHKVNKKNYLLFEYAKKIYSPLDVVSVDASGVAASKSSKIRTDIINIGLGYRF